MEHPLRVVWMSVKNNWKASKTLLNSFLRNCLRHSPWTFCESPYWFAAWDKAFLSSPLQTRDWWRWQSSARTSLPRLQSLEHVSMSCSCAMIFSKNEKEHAERQWVAWRSGKMQVLPVIRRVFGAHHLLRWNSTLLRQNHWCKELDSPEKTWGRYSHSWDLWHSTTNDSSQIFSNCSAFDKATDKIRWFWRENGLPRCFWSTESLLRKPVLKHHDLSLPRRIETDSSGTPLVLCWIKNILMVGTLQPVYQGLQILQRGTTRLKNKNCSAWSMLWRSGDITCLEWK
jgi:hypothetical protein